MEIDELKSAWNDVEIPAKKPDEIRLMLKENRHPVLKGIKRQALMETTGWLAFLICYYTMLDGGYKPLSINVLIIVCVLFPLIHNLMSYRFAKYLVQGNTIRESVRNYLANVRVYACVSVAARILFACGLLIFLTYGIKFNPAKYFSLGIIILIFLVQLALLGNVWLKRLNKLNTILTYLN
jgi:hypothetical protein